MRKIFGLAVFVLLLFSYGFAFAVPTYINDIGADTAVTAWDDPNDSNDAYAAVAQWGEQYALASIQGTHSHIAAEAIYQYGFELQGAKSVDLQIDYNLMYELLSLNQASVSAKAEIGIYQYESWPGLTPWSLTSIYPVWSDTIWAQVLEPLDQPYSHSGEKLNATDALSLLTEDQWGSYHYKYVVELRSYVWGKDTYRIQYTPGEYENPDAWYSAAAYADPTFTVLTSGATLTEFMIPEGSFTQSGGTLDPPSILQPGGSGPNPVPEPATVLLLGTGVVGLAARARRRMKKA